MSSSTGPARTVGQDGTGVRAHNLLTVLRDLSDHGPSARVDIATRTGLSRSSLTGLTAILARRGLITELDNERSSGRGRPGQLIDLDGSRLAVVAVQVRLDDLAVQLRDLRGRVVHHQTRPWTHRPPTPEQMAQDIANSAAALQDLAEGDELTILRVGVAMAGPVGGTPARVARATDFGWLQSVDLAALVQTALTASGCAWPVDLHNDASMAALAERDKLIETGTLVYLKSDIGIGGAVFANGDLLRGASGLAFEPGHIVVDPAGQRCTCGQRGCLVTVAGPDVVLRQAGLADPLAERGEVAALAELVARRGEPQIDAAVDQLVTRLAALVMLTRLTFDPDVVVLGGYWAHLAPQVNQRMQEQVPDAYEDGLWRRDLAVAGKCGPDAPLSGIAMVSRWAALAELTSTPDPAP